MRTRQATGARREGEGNLPGLQTERSESGKTLLSGKKLAAAVRVLAQDARPVANLKNPRRRKPKSRRGRAQLILAGQVDDVVGEVEFHFVNREVRERDLLRIDGVPIPVVAEHGRAAVRVNLQVPDLEFFG